MKNETIAVSEVFYSLQGEGRTVGIPSVFLRLKSCNLTCGFTQKQGNRFVKGEIDEVVKDVDDAEWFCDTANVFLKGSQVPFEKVLDGKMVLRLYQGAHLVITGGEPLLQKKKIKAYLEWFRNKHNFTPFIELETNGTIVVDFPVNQINCSPKLSNSGIDRKIRYDKDVLYSLGQQGNVIFKFVISRQEQWEEIVKDFLPFIDRKKVWLMPPASTLKELLINNKLTAQIAIDQCVNFTSRMQVEVWDQTTGV